MSNSNKFIIFYLISLHIICMPKMSNSADCCKPVSCNKKSSLSYRSSQTIEFPFRSKGDQRESCGSPGFDIYCDNELGPLLELPGAGNFTVDYVYYYSRKIELSDPDDCLPQKLLNLDLMSLATTPFRVTHSQVFTLYNCSSFDDFDPIFYEKIDCLSGSNYTVISRSEPSLFISSNCRFLKDVSVPTYSEYVGIFSYLSIYSSIDLTWDEQEPCIVRDTGHNLAWIGGLVAVILLMLLCVYCIWRVRRSRRNDEAPIIATTSTTTGHAISHTAAYRGPGLDPITINSYPMVVVGESGRLIKPDNDNCPICLTDYFPGDTLKILPECLHRFHADCIDLWLISKPTCPICRIFPTNHIQDTS